MRARWLYVAFLLVLLYQLTEAQRRNRRSNQIQSRVSTNAGRVRTNPSTRSSGVQSRIISNSNSNSNRRRNRNRRSSRRSRLLGRNTRNRVNRRRRNGITSRIINNSAQGRIVGSSTASISSMPYLVQVHRGSTSFCGGTLIDTQWVLTAAHCTSGRSASDFYVIGGTSTLNGTDGVSRTVSFLAVAPRFTRRTMNMDASLLKLSSPLTGTNIGTIPLATRRPRAGTSLRVAGWGATTEGGSSVTTLRATRVPVVSQRQCVNDYRGQSTITRLMICAGNRNRDTCSGDSGGPAVNNGVLYGITSFGMGCARAGYPGIYTNVARIRNWINTTMANN